MAQRLGKAAMAEAENPRISALSFKILAECPVSKARVAKMALPHHTVDTPVFMPVGTQGTLKGMTPKQLEDLDCQILLGNTYHLGNRPGCKILEQIGGLHRFMGWNRALLTDSGGFQMVSLLKLAEITEEGVKFRSPHDDTEMLLTPEHSVEIQNTIGADIIMQLDDVVHSMTTGPRVEEAMWRTVRWLDRCVAVHQRPASQSLFPIVQGGLQPELRRKCVEALVQRDLPGYAIGGLSGGEEKDVFWRIVSLCTDHLPRHKPRYLMGVGFPVDLVVCCALGVDMFDCVYPTRTARFGNALVPWGQLDLKRKDCATDFSPIDSGCPCTTCAHHSRASLHPLVVQKETVACNLITIHNLTYQLSLMQSLRQSVLEGCFPQFVQQFMERQYPTGDYEQWAVNALAAVNIHLRLPTASACMMGCGTSTSRSRTSRVAPASTHHPPRDQGTSISAQEPAGGGGPRRPVEPASEKPPKVEEPGGEVAGGVGQEGEGLIRVESVGSMELTALSAVPTEKPDSEAQLPATSPAVVSPDKQDEPANQAKPEEEEPVKPRESLVEQTPVEPLNLSEVAGDSGDSEQQAASSKEKEGEGEEGGGAAESEDKAEKSSPSEKQKDVESAKSAGSATEKTAEKPSDKPEDESVKDAETSKEGPSEPQAEKEEGKEEGESPSQTDEVAAVDHRTGQSESNIIKAVEKSEEGGTGTGDAPVDVGVKGEGSKEGEESKKEEGAKEGEGPKEEEGSKEGEEPKEAPKAEEVTASS